MKRVFTYIFLIALSWNSYGQLDRSEMPTPGPAPVINLEEPYTFELNNGLKVLVVENHKLPRVSFQLLIDNPPILEGDKAGISGLVGSLLGNGSKSIPKDEFNEEIDFLGANISFGSQSAFANSLSKYFPRILELMADAAINPNFTQEEFDKEKDILITGLKTQENNVSSIASRLQGALSYGVNHPYGEFTTEETVNNVQLVDVVNFYNNYFVPANAYLVVIGDVQLDNVKELVEQHFTPWTKASPPSFSYTNPTDAQYTQVNFVDVPNAVQSVISVQNLVELKMSDEDYLKAKITNFVLGGASVSRLEKKIREEKAYTYAARSRLGDNKHGVTTFRASTSVRNTVTDSTIVELLNEIDNIMKAPITEEELANAKASYVGSFVRALEQPSTIANYALDIETEGLPKDFYKTYLERINAITVDDVQKAAQKYFNVKNARIVVAGKGSDVLDNLEKVNFNGKKVPVLYYDKYANKTEKPDYSAAVPEGMSVQSVVDKYFEAIGGKDKVAQINSLKLVYEGEAMGAKIKSEEKRTTDKFAQTTYMNDAPMMSVIAKGGELYMKQGGQKRPLPPQMQQDMLSAAKGVFPEQNFVPGGKAKIAGTEEVDGKEAVKIEVPGEVVQVVYYYDMETGLKVKEAQIISMNGQTQNQEVFYKDYQEIEGMKFPGIRVGSMGPQKVESKLLEAVINIEVSDADFE
ncbi:MAG: insulinase family protein [Eudoraea sp.]|nr:insulinase family protein [Eudoraea sp.]